MDSGVQIAALFNPRALSETINASLSVNGKLLPHVMHIARLRSPGCAPQYSFFFLPPNSPLKLENAFSVAEVLDYYAIGSGGPVPYDKVLGPLREEDAQKFYDRFATNASLLFKTRTYAIDQLDFMALPEEPDVDSVKALLDWLGCYVVAYRHNRQGSFMFNFISTGHYAVLDPAKILNTAGMRELVKENPEYKKACGPYTLSEAEEFVTRLARHNIRTGLKHQANLKRQLKERLAARPA